MLFSAYILDRIGYLLLLAFTLVLAIVAMLLHGLSIFVLSLVIGLVAVCSCVTCLLYTSPSPRDRTRSRMPSSA